MCPAQDYCHFCVHAKNLSYGLLLILDCMPGNSVMYKMNTSVMSSCYFIFPLAPLYISHMHLAADIRGETLVVEGGLHF